MGHLNKYVLAGLLILLVSGCAQMQPWIDKVWPQRAAAQDRGPAPGEHEAASIVERDVLDNTDLTTQQYLVYFQELSTLTKNARRIQIEKTGAKYKKSGETRHGILYALTLIADTGDASASREALKILDELQSRILKTGKDAEQTALVHMLWKMVRTQVALQVKTARLSTHVGSQQERLVVLEEQIKALKNIEKSIYEREIGIASQD